MSSSLPPYEPQPSYLRSLMHDYHQQINAQVDATVNDLQQRWVAARAAINADIARLQQQMETAIAHGDQITYAWLSDAQRLAALKASVEGNIAQFADGVRTLVGQGQLSAIDLGTTAAQDTLAATVPPGLSYTFGVPPADVLHAQAGALSPNSPLTALFAQLGPDAAKSAQAALFTSVALGEGPRAAATRLFWNTNLPRQRAEVIARTEILRSWRGAQMENYRANQDVVSGWQWSADFSDRTCGACIAMDGTIHDLSEDLDDHANGRCSALPITKPWSDILAGTGADTSGLTETSIASWDSYLYGNGFASDWFEGLAPEVQNSILGPAKAEAYRAGDLDLKQLAGVRQDPVWGDSIQEVSLKQLGLDAQDYLATARANGTDSMVADAEALAQAQAGTPAAMVEKVTQPLGEANDASTSPIWQQLADKLTQEPSVAEIPEGFAETPYTGPTADYVRQVDEYLAPRIEQYAALHPEMTVDEYKAAVTAHLQDLIEGAVPSVRVPQEVLGNILDDGRLKTSLEVGAHGIIDNAAVIDYYNAQRIAFEERAFGYDAEMAVHERPISGYITAPGSDSTLAMSYGDARIMLTPDAMDRATVTFGDSLLGNGNMTPYPAANAQWDMYDFPANLNPAADWGDQVQTYYDLLPTYDPLAWSSIDDYAKLGSNTLGGSFDRYVETQFHGGVGVSDIQEIVFTGQTPPDAELAQRLEDAGIKWSYEPAQNIGMSAAGYEPGGDF